MSATAPAADPPPPRCEACRRTKLQLTVGTLEATQIDGVGDTFLCTSRTDCHRHWPETP